MDTISTTATVNGREYAATAEVVGSPSLGILEVISVTRGGLRVERDHEDYGAVCTALRKALSYRQMSGKQKREMGA